MIPNRRCDGQSARLHRLARGRPRAVAKGAWDWLARDVHAVPLDVFRVLAGLLCLAYFIRLWLEIPDFSSPDGLVDHQLLYRVYWFTRLGLFHPGMSTWVFYGVFSLAILGACGLVVGYRVKLCAGVLFVIAVSAYRWNFIVMYVDDAIMHVLLFWLLLLPVGHTLTLGAWWRQGKDCWAPWMHVRVSGVTLRCFLGNVALVYLVAGLWKFESPLWHQGFAVYATLRLPIAYHSEWWQPAHLPVLQLANYFALIIEPLLPFLLTRRRGSWLKWGGLVAQVGFHLGIIATLRIPFANIALIATAVLFFREELMDALRRLTPAEHPVTRPAQRKLSGYLACIFLVLLTLAMMRRLPIIGEVHKPAYAILWLAGIAQDYQLFNWIDRKNFAIRYRVEAESAEGERQALEPSLLFPTTLRAVLIQSYIHNVRWIAIPLSVRPQLKRSILTRLAQRYCRLYPGSSRISAWSEMQRVRPTNASLTEGRKRFVMRFQCEETSATVCRTLVDRLDHDACLKP